MVFTKRDSQKKVCYIFLIQMFSLTQPPDTCLDKDIHVKC